MIKPAEYARRRENLLQMIGPGSVVLLQAASEKTRNSDVLYPYRQDSDFLYMSGFSEPKAVLVLVAGASGNRSLLFCRPADPDRAIWDGPRAGLEGALADFGMDESFDIAELDKRLPALMEAAEKVYYKVGSEPEFDRQIMRWMHQLHDTKDAHIPQELVSLEHDLHELRLFKSKAEVKAMRKAAKVAAKAHIEAMKAAPTATNEAELQAELFMVFYRNHCPWSYQPIVGAGDNGCVLHYIDNNMSIKQGDLILIDAGCECEGYASDITRTFPANGHFSAEQKALYELVLKSQLAAIEEIRPGKQWLDAHRVVVDIITAGLVELGLLEGELDELIDAEAYKEFYMHKTGHWLGLDVHDVGDYTIDGESRQLEPGMVLTVEPGLYIAPDCELVEPRWRGIGIRIEDDVLVTREGCEVLSKDAPKSVKEIEALMQGK
ncbi:MAG: aminopeptidase P N-terminal domain-containing protein [Proteobacteria bacterium]|nr:aminopeptidase P N-terminal domain-containing protein [Pseudomonadota bacterium]